MVLHGGIARGRIVRGNTEAARQAKMMPRMDELDWA
jgi:hypothetical protein